MVWTTAVRLLTGTDFFFATAPRLALGLTQLPSNWYRGLFPRSLKRPVREADHLPQSGAEIKNEWNYTSTPPYVFMA
jgi:hypothetical protein